MRRAISIEAQTAAVQAIGEPAADTYEAHAKIAAGKLDLKDLDLRERAFLGTCQDLYRNASGCGTPFEEFLRSIIRFTTWGNTPTPEDLIEHIKQDFEEDFEMTLHSVKRFMHHYPSLISSLQEGNKATPATPEPRAELERTQPATKQPAKAQRARKPRKKVSRAA